ncbi:MAG: TIGR04086 family membrane protein [Actinomycetota bacterium]
MVTRESVEARGGVSGGAVLTGVVVAFGAMVILTALIGAALTALGVSETAITQGEAIEAGIGAGMALVLAQFLSYLWGGYTAGRMGRGAGFGNGMLVPVVAILVAVLVGAVAAAVGATANLNLPFTTNRLPLENEYLVNWGIGIGIASLVAMFLGGILGGIMGARWHTKLEQRVYEEEHVATGGVPVTGTAAPATTGTKREIDLRSDIAEEERHPTTTVRR